VDTLPSVSQMPRTIAYMMSRFPKISETFILFEILELQRQGLRVEVFPLLREKTPVLHPEAVEVVERAHYVTASPELATSQLYWLLRSPRAYVRAWSDSITGNLGSPRFLARALAVVPEAALMARRMEKLGVEHIHAHYATHPALAAFVVHRLTGIPYSFTAQAHDIYVDRSMLGEKLQEADSVVAISDFNRRMLVDLYGQDAARKTVIIRSGVDTSLFHPSRREPRGDGRAFQALCVASLQDYKGHPFLLDAAAQLMRDGLEFRILCVGEGEDRPAIEARIAELGLGERVQLLGAQPRQRVVELLSESDAFVLPSIITDSGKMEGIPLALMEALAMETPVVATDISGLAELVVHEETGLLVPQRDGAALADALGRLAGDDALSRALGKRGREKVLAEYDVKRNEAALAALLSGDREALAGSTADVPAAF
jgi:colanic acid/amylovoran biosynthesis glycosyltransferase